MTWSEKSGDAFRGNGKLRPEQEEIRQLREENRRLKIEKDIFKKSAANSTGLCNTPLNLSSGDKKLRGC